MFPELLIILMRSWDEKIERTMVTNNTMIFLPYLPIIIKPSQEKTTITAAKVIAVVTLIDSYPRATTMKKKKERKPLYNATQNTLQSSQDKLTYIKFK